MSFRRRIALACLGSALIGVLATVWGFYLWHRWHFHGDDYTGIHLGLGLVELGLVSGTVALPIVCYLVARFALRPLRPMTETLSWFGPQNLGRRVEVGGRHDELRDLADELDDMLDRFAAGYEGQRLFAANASHELRTPLAVQRALIELSMESGMTDEQFGLLARQLLRANERNEALIEGLLVLSESDRGLVSRSDLALDKLTHDIVESYRELADRTGVTLVLRAAEREVRGEQVLLERLVGNLVQNAIKYSVPGGRVDVIVGQHSALRVVNTGDPVPAEAIGRIFEPYRRLATDRLSHQGGAGLGLPIARSIVQAHEGVIPAKPGPA